MTTQSTQQAYAQSVGTTPTNYFVIIDRNPTTNDVTYPQGKVWLNPVLGSLWYLNNFFITAGNVFANWVALSATTTLLEFLEGNDNVIVPPNAAYTIKIIGAGNIVVNGNATTNTLTISQTNTISGSVTTNGLQTKTLAVIPTSANSTNTISGNIAGYGTPIGAGVTAGIGGFLSATFISGSAFTSSIDIPDVISHSFLSSTAEYTATGSGLNILIQVIGDVGYNVDWTGTFTIQTAT